MASPNPYKWGSGGAELGLNPYMLESSRTPQAHPDAYRAQSDNFMAQLSAKQPTYFKTLASAPAFRPVLGLSQVGAISQ